MKSEGPHEGLLQLGEATSMQEEKNTLIRRIKGTCSCLQVLPVFC